jgi:hypothetical protein
MPAHRKRGLASPHATVELLSSFKPRPLLTDFGLQFVLTRQDEAFRNDPNLLCQIRAKRIETHADIYKKLKEVGIGGKKWTWFSRFSNLTPSLYLCLPTKGHGWNALKA